MVAVWCDLYWDSLQTYWTEIRYCRFKIFLQGSRKTSTVNHKNSKWHCSLFYKQSLLEDTLQISASSACQISSVCHIPGANRRQRQQRKQVIKKETKWVNPLGTNWMVKSDLSLYDLVVVCVYVRERQKRVKVIYSLTWKSATLLTML